MEENGNENTGKRGISEEGPRRLGDEQEQQETATSQEGVEKSEAVSANEVAALKQDVDKWKNEYLYLKAEFDNYRKNVIKERSDFVKYGPERLVAQLLEIIDIFEKALATKVTPENLESFKQGMEMTYGQLKNVLGHFGVEEVPSLGKPFDPSLHEAMSSEETDKVEPGHISQVFRKGFKMHDRLIRPAQVIVAKEKSVPQA